MKPNAIASFQSILSVKSRKNLTTNDTGSSYKFNEFALPEIMTHQKVDPPAHVWEKIAKALDEQDRKQKTKDKH